MNRRDLLRWLSLAPVAAPVVARAVADGVTTASGTTLPVVIADDGVNQLVLRDNLEEAFEGLERWKGGGA